MPSSAASRAKAHVAGILGEYCGTLVADGDEAYALIERWLQ